MNYKTYIQSKRWKKKSRAWILEQGFCEKCRSGNNLTCHHKTYKTLGFERRKDIIVLCWDCHSKYYQVRKERIKTIRLQNAIIKAKENYKEHIKHTVMVNEMKTQFRRKGKIKGFSKSKSKKLIKYLNTL